MVRDLADLAVWAVVVVLVWGGLMGGRNWGGGGKECGWVHLGGWSGICNGPCVAKVGGEVDGYGAAVERRVRKGHGFGLSENWVWRGDD